MALARGGTDADYSTEARLEIEGGQFSGIFDLPNVESFSYVSDVFALGDPLAVVVPDPRGKYRGKIRPGLWLNYYMRHPSVNGGSWTRKVRGIIVGLETTSEASSGTRYAIRGADLGWHLQNNDAPLWFSLKGTGWDRLLKGMVAPHLVFPGTPDPQWGFVGTDGKVKVRSGNDLNRRSKLGARTAATLGYAAPALKPLIRIQVEPGMKCADVITTHARREGYFVNVSGDGYLQIFVPNYQINPDRHTFRIEYHGEESDHSARERNNVESVRISESINRLYTHVKVVSEIVNPDLLDDATAKDNPNASKFHNEYVDPTYGTSAARLPFAHKAVLVDTEQLNRRKCTARAEWEVQKGLFDSWTYKAVVRRHQQGGCWWESDWPIEIDDTVNGVKGKFYIAAVQCSRDNQSGDRTELTICKADVLCKAGIPVGAETAATVTTLSFED